MVKYDENNVLLLVVHLKKWFPLKKKTFEEKKYVKAVDDVNFKVYKGETLGLVGESGCGKSTLIRTVLRLIPPTDGEIVYNGRDITDINDKLLRAERKDMQVVFQDPFASLHPKMTIQQILEEPLIINKIGNKKERKQIVQKMIERVGLKKEHLDRYPFEFSGGQRQRIVIARALITNPKFVILDEPVSALDVSIRSQILNLLEELQREMNLTYLFISHDLSVVEHICNRVMVMYLGHVVEMGTREQIFNDPKHPYTQALLSAIPSQDRTQERIILSGEIPSPVNPPKGCVFKTRCRHCTAECDKAPTPVEVDGHFVVCHRCSSQEYKYETTSD